MVSMGEHVKITNYTTNLNEVKSTFAKAAKNKKLILENRKQIVFIAEIPKRKTQSLEKFKYLPTQSD